MDAPPQCSARNDSLLAAAQAGDTAAFWQLAQSYLPYFKAVAAGMLGKRLAGKVDSSDVAQESLMVAFEQLADFRGQDASQWQAWVLAIVKSQSQRQLRYWHQQKRDVRHESSGCCCHGSNCRGRC
jgi:DNA-directed RNA polymerase specialized sigma24 family protein